MNTRLYLCLCLLLTLVVFRPYPAPSRADEPLQAQAAPTLGGCPVFPADNIWNAPNPKE